MRDQEYTHPVLGWIFGGGFALTVVFLGLLAFAQLRALDNKEQKPEVGSQVINNHITVEQKCYVFSKCSGDTGIETGQDQDNQK